MAFYSVSSIGYLIVRNSFKILSQMRKNTQLFSVMVVNVWHLWEGKSRKSDIIDEQFNCLNFVLKKTLN